MRILILLLVACPAFAATYHVNNQTGNDAHDGLTPEKPFATIRRAVQAARTSDTISLAKTSVAYREPIALTRLGGTPAKLFVIEGNGATISGLRVLTPQQWKKDGEVYELAGPKPYGWPYLVIDGQRTPPARQPDRLGPGEWVWITDSQDKAMGRVRFRPANGKTPADYRLEAALEVSGVCIVSSSYIAVRNLISECHSNDGFNIHGDCRGIYCENIEARANGDDGFSIHEATDAVVRNGHFHHNGSGIEDGNLSRSMYSGIRVHDNTRLGVLFAGAFHSAVDAVVHDNPRNFMMASSANRHLTGGPQSPLGETSVYLQNVVAWGGGWGIHASGKCRVMVANSIFARSQTGIEILDEARLHLTKSIVAHCGDLELRCAGREFFGDYNLYYPGRFFAGQRTYQPKEWPEFLKAVGHNQHSSLEDPRLSADHLLTDDTPRQLDKETIGPTANYFQPAHR